MKRIVILLLAISAFFLTGCKKKYDCHFHITAISYYNYSPTKTMYEIFIKGHEKSSYYQRVSEDGILDIHIDERELVEGEYEVKIVSSVYITNIGKLVVDRVTWSVFVPQYGDNYYENDFILHLQ